MEHSEYYNDPDRNKPFPSRIRQFKTYDISTAEPIKNITLEQGIRIMIDGARLYIELESTEVAKP